MKKNLSYTIDTGYSVGDANCGTLYCGDVPVAELLVPHTIKHAHVNYSTEGFELLEEAGYDPSEVENWLRNGKIRQR